MSGNIIIVKKKKASHGGHHGGAWKVAFADFMTAMMAFFMVMWLIAMKQDVKLAIAAYFRDPGAFESTRGGLLQGGSGALDGASASPAKTAIKEETSRQALERAAQRMRQELAKEVGLEQLGKQVEITITNEGLRIELLDSEETMFFESGSAALKPGTERMLALIARELGRLGRPVIVEGHTDSRPYTGRNAYSNWDLSADRANSARRIVEASGLAREQIRSVRGYADRHLRVTSAPADARNRRVSLVVPLDGKGN